MNAVLMPRGIFQKRRLVQRNNVSPQKKRGGKLSLFQPHGFGRCLIAGILTLLSFYVVILRRALELQSEDAKSPDQCRTETQLCMAEVGAIAHRCTAQQELPLPWASQTFHDTKPSKNPLVCMVVTTYNVEEFIGPCLETILKQTYRNIEVIVVDDSSTDNTVKLIQTYRNNDKRVRAIELRHNTNGGAGQPSNIGMESCSKESEYIMLVDGDDYMELDAVASVVEQAQRFDADVVMGDFDSFTVNQTTGKITYVPAYDIEKWEKLPEGVPFNLLTHPVVLRASPVPWRKLYKRKFMQAYDLKFPEGDYFFEDNLFQWVVLGHAARVTKIDRVFFHHRKQRKGQTSYNFETSDKDRELAILSENKKWEDYSNAARVSGYLPNLYKIGQLLFTGLQKNLRSQTCTRVAVKDIAAVYFQFLEASRWIIKTQKSIEMENKFSRLFVQYRDHWLEKVPTEYKPALTKAIYGKVTPRAERKNVDLSLILPTFNVEALLPSLLESMYQGLDLPDFTFEIFAVDDGSSDDTVKILRKFAEEHKENFFLLSTSSSKAQLGAGRARNRAIPLVEGRYVYFVDADDIYDFPALADAVNTATASSIDVLIVPYKTEYVKPEGSKTEGMLEKDQRAWKRIWTSSFWSPPGQETRQSIALDMINYPWKQLTSSTLIRDADVFFGPTRVHNDIQFHWTSITASRNLQFHDTDICTHRKFDPAVRGQLTEVKSIARLTAIDAISLTQRALAQQGAFEGVFGKKTFEIWKTFVKTLIKWAAERVPEEWMSEYQMRSERLLQALARLDPLALRSWPYWGGKQLQIDKATDIQ